MENGTHIQGNVGRREERSCYKTSAEQGGIALEQQELVSLSLSLLPPPRAEKSRVSERGDEDDNDHVDGELVLSIEKLQEIQDELEKINEEASDKVLEVEQKYNEIRRPVYSKRNEIIQSIPDFWLTAFLSHPALCDLLNEDDQKIFKYLLSLDVEDFKDVKSGYSITLNFSPNPYFEDTKLTKTYSFSDDGTTKITGTTIKWKEGMGVANGGDHTKKGSKRPFFEESIVFNGLQDSLVGQRLKLKGLSSVCQTQDRTLFWTLSFFSWFAGDQHKDLSEGFNDEVADILKEDLWPNPLKYVTNDADEEDSNGDDDDEEVQCIPAIPAIPAKPPDLACKSVWLKIFRHSGHLIDQSPDSDMSAGRMSDYIQVENTQEKENDEDDDGDDDDGDDDEEDDSKF
ncbi:hypothetical protein ACLOJK_013033 [Asimina triloba]